MQPAGLTPLLNVRDVAASTAFYETLGFTIAERWDDGPGRAWRLQTCGAQRLMLNETTRSASDERRARGDYADLVLYIYVDDAPAAWAELEAAGLAGRHVGPQDYGLDEVWLRDPDGYHVVVASDA